MSSLPFGHLILLEPLGFLYGSLGRLLSPEALTALMEPPHAAAAA